jgi:PAP_fibrillin
MIKSTALFVSLALGASHAFVVQPHLSRPARSRILRSTTADPPPAPEVIDVQDLSKIAEAKEDLLMVCRRLKDRHGLFLLDVASKSEFESAVKALEDGSERPDLATFGERIVGDWTLLCTTSTTQPGVDESKIPGFFREGPLQQLRDNIRQATNRYLTVHQVVKKAKAEDDGDDASSSSMAAAFDRIDHVLEYAPPSRFGDFLDNVPTQLSQLNLNPLDVSKSKLSLVHTATMEGGAPPKIKLALKSIVLNVAGTSTFLEADGKDLLGVNLPWGEFTNTGVFETTYMDDTLRVSRGKQGPFEQLRVFVKTGAVVTAGVVDDIATMEAEGKLDSTVNSADEGSDVDDSTDPEFDATEGQNDVSPSDY